MDSKHLIHIGLHIFKHIMEEKESKNHYSPTYNNQNLYKYNQNNYPYKSSYENLRIKLLRI